MQILIGRLIGADQSRTSMYAVLAETQMTMMQNVAAHQGSYCSLKKPKKKMPRARFQGILCCVQRIRH